MAHLSRREFASVVAGGALLGVRPAGARASVPQGRTLSVGDVLDRIRAAVGVAWQTDTVDTLKAGDLTTPVTGIVTTSLATLAVLRQATDVGANLIVSGQPLFYSRNDTRTPPTGRGNAPPPPDPVFDARNAYVNEHALALFRLNDHWKRREPNPYAVGLARALGWRTDQGTGDAARYDVPATTLEALAHRVKRQLNLRGGIRVIGNRETRVSRVGLLPGSTPITASLETLPDVDVIVAGEVREWESTEYVRDVVHAGGRKGLILIGRIVSEEPGMAECAEWLASLVSGVPVRHIAAGDPYWRPA